MAGISGDVLDIMLCVTQMTKLLLQVQLRFPEQNPTVAALYRSMAGAGVGSESARKLFHTQYHRREKTLTASVGDW